jgi:hypothetical protein
MHKNATKCNKTQSKWCVNKHGALKIIDTFETYHATFLLLHLDSADNPSARRSLALLRVSPIDKGMTPRVLDIGLPATAREQDGHSKPKKPKTN